MAQRPPDRSRSAGQGWEAGRDRQRIGLHAGAIFPGLVREERTRQHGHHRRQSRGASPREHEGAGGFAKADRRYHETGGRDRRKARSRGMKKVTVTSQVTVTF